MKKSYKYEFIRRKQLASTYGNNRNASQLNWYEKSKRKQSNDRKHRRTSLTTAWRLNHNTAFFPMDLYN